MLKTRSSYPGFAQTVAGIDWARCEALIEEFEKRWQQGASPSIADYLLTDSGIRRPLLVELVHVDLEFRLKARESARVDDYLWLYPELEEDPEVTVDLLAAEYNLRRRRGEQVDTDEYARRFPQLQPMLLERLTRETSVSPISTITARQADSPLPEVPGYELLAQVGRGGMGVVYKARDTTLDRHVAIKFLPSEYAESRDRLERFMREARTASALNHPHICTVHSLGEHDGRPFLVMEFVQGRTLRDLAEQRPPLEDIVSWLRQAALALAAAHGAGVVHRDIKPENIMVREDGYVKVLDFGLARRLPAMERTAPAAPDTAAGVLLGTVAYMSPEQTRGKSVGSASDVFSLAIVAYQLLTGIHPFESNSRFGLLDAIANMPAVSPASVNPEIPAALSELLEGMLHKNPQLRPAAADVEASLAALSEASMQPVKNGRLSRPVVHRERELDVLREAFAGAAAGCGGFVCIGGEPGIGKTTLVEDFLSELSTRPGECLIAAGNCSEHLADTEVYLPVLDAMNNLLRHGTAGGVARVMQMVAPAWFAQLSPTVRFESPDRADPPRAGSQPAMLRQFLSFLSESARLGTFVLWLDDVHWSDPSTVDLLAHLGRYVRDLRVLVIVTYRPSEMLLGMHPFRRLKMEMQGRGICKEITLGLLTAEEVALYMQLAFPQNRFPEELARRIYVRTDGNPLFVVELLRYLCECGMLQESDGEWSATHELDDFPRDLPESIRGMIERMLDQLGEVERRLLAMASVQGQQFDSAIVADALGLPVADVEDQLVALENVHGLIRLEREHELPDGTLNQRYRFVHALFQSSLAGALSPSRRASYGLELAKSQERHHASDLSPVASELACLNERGRDFSRAARYFHLAAQNASRVFAHQEAAALARRGLELLNSLSDTPERAALEFPLQVMRGQQVQAAEGFTVGEAEQAFHRARELYSSVVVSPEPLAQVLWGLFTLYKVRSDLTKARAVAEELLKLGRAAHDPAIELHGHQALGVTSLSRGDPRGALECSARAVALCVPDNVNANALMFGPDPRAVAKSYGWLALWLCGRPEEAQRQCNAALELAADLAPTNQVMAFLFAAILDHFLGHAQRCCQRCETANGIAREHGMRWWQAWGSVLRGWSLAMRGEDEGIELMQTALSELQATGSLSYRTYHLALLAEAFAARGEFNPARRALDEALDVVVATDERFWEAEIYRVRGELRLQSSDSMQEAAQQADSDFRTALQIAHDQGACSLELRAAVSLARLHRESPAFAEAQRQLADVYGRFTEGLDTTDARAADSLLSE